MQNKTWIWVSVGVVIVGVVVWQLASILLSSDPDAAENPEIVDPETGEVIETSDGLRVADTVESTPDELREAVAEVNETADAVVGGGTPERTEDEELEASLGAFSASFIERIGSYSSTSNFSNLKQAMPLMSDRYRAKTQALISGSGGPAAESFSVLARSLSTKALERGDSSAVYVVTIQKENTDADGQVTRTYQTAEVDLVKVGQDWFVDEVRWGAEGDL